ncbi:hypothetical protein LWI29_035654 [Acer saccharum]|uniref:S-acyltransferase n=1 Tax=Acer saccharum TaxID=4024 RepID=A0AA39T5R5_ACESA|nr:hypothetical protein LWI29_035654 [Acer saccharum]
MNSVENQGFEIRPFFDEKVAFPILEELDKWSTCLSFETTLISEFVERFERLRCSRFGKQDSYDSERFSMHDVAISIASRDHHVLMGRNDMVPSEWPGADALRKCTAIIMSNGDISELPEVYEDMRGFARESRNGMLEREGMRDYRNSLFSIFVDNLNPQVDVKGLWGIFKVFGKVRDVFLSSRSSPRKSAFAFIRFAKSEEALKVAKITNGMHVYSWPIRTKVADYGRSNRRSEVPKGPGLKPRGARRGVAKDMDSIYRPVVQDNLSFADAVKKNGPDVKMTESKEKWKPNKINRVWINGNVNDFVPEQVGKSGHSASFSKKEKGKGKLQLLRKPFVRPTMQENRKAKVIFEKKRKGCQSNGYEYKDVGNIGPDDGLLMIQGDRPIVGPLPLGTESRAAQFWIDIGPKEASHEGGDVEGLTGSDGGTRVKETLVSDSKSGSPVDKGSQGPGSGFTKEGQIKELQMEADRSSNRDGQIGNAQVGMTISKKRRKKIIYLSILGATYYFIASSSFKYIPGYYLSEVHRYLSLLGIAIGVVLFLLTSYTDPGTVNAENVSQYIAAYPYDNMIYTEKECSTCKILKPARSKHCSICDRCVARFDHHCGWMNNCIGEKNTRYFMAFLLCVLQAFLSLFIWNCCPWVDSCWTIERIKSCIYTNSIVSLLVGGFFGYHANLCRTNTTTNETFKWQDYISWQRKIKEAKASAAALKASINGMSSESKPPESKWKAFFRRSPLEEAETVVKNNMYDKGIIHNIWEIITPLSTRRSFSQTKSKAG